MASTGISALLIPAVFSGEVKPSVNADDNAMVNDIVIIAATASWIFLLGLFFSWSLSLRRLIDVIASYLKMYHLSEWEEKFSNFHKTSKLHISQTKFSLWIFISYGLIVTISGVIAVNDPDWSIALGLIGLIYFVFCILKYRTNSKSKQIEKAWKEVLDKHKIMAQE